MRQRLAALAHEVEANILAAVHKFHGDFPQADDVTVMVIRREPGRGGDPAL